MSIGAGLTLVTGATGSGKTALVVSWLAEIKDRPLFTMGIPELTIDHEPTPPVADWTEQRPSDEDQSLLLSYFTFPPNSIVVVDEAQRVFRPRSAASKVPPEVAAFETRRHTGSDFVLLTQAPHLLDANIRKLVTRHVHIHDTFLGRYKLEWVGIGDPDNKASRELASRERYTPPPKAFPLYKSSELHTKIVRKYPWYIYLFALCVPLAIALGWYSYTRINAKITKPELTETSKDSKPAKIITSSGDGTQDVYEYLASYAPRLAGLPHTAPVYDSITKPVEAPVPVGCYEIRATCNCITQQGTRYQTTPDTCRDFIQNGMFIPWKATPEPQPFTLVSAKDEKKQKPQQVSNAQPPYDGKEVQDILGGSHIFSGGLSSDSSPPAGDSTNPRYNPSIRPL